MYTEIDVDRSILRADILKTKLSTNTKYFKIIEEYAIKMDLNACDYTAYALSTYDTKDLDVFQFFCKGAYKHAEILANLLYNAGSIYASAHAITPNKEWIVQTGLDTVVRLRELSFSILYTEIKSVYNGDKMVKCNQINQQLIFIYGNMMNPAYRNDFESLHHQEIVLCAMYKKFIQSKSLLKNIEFVKLSGGRTRAQIKKNIVTFDSEDRDAVGSGPNTVFPIIAEVVLRTIKKYKCVIISSHAYRLMCGKDISIIQGQPIKIVYDNIAILTREINRELEDIGVTLIGVASNPSIPKYERMIRTKLIYESGNRSIDIIENFSNSEFTLIPYNIIKDYTCISVYGIIFFKLVDLWIIKLIEAIRLKQGKKINMDAFYQEEEKHLNDYFIYYDLCITMKKYEYIYPTTFVGVNYPLREYEKSLSHNNLFKGPMNYLANGKIHY
jgi:hypothetical protein